MTDFQIKPLMVIYQPTSTTVDSRDYVGLSPLRASRSNSPCFSYEVDTPATRGNSLRFPSTENAGKN